MDIREFYVFRETFKGSYFRARPNNLKDIDINSLQRGLIVPDSDLVFNHSKGNTIKDYIPTTHSILHLFSSRVFSEFKEKSITGFEGIPVSLKNKKNETIDGYSLLVVTGTCGNTYTVESTIRVIPPPTEFGKPMEAYIGIFFDMDSWDGSDIFIAKNSGFIFFTERVKDIFLELNIGNLTIKKISEMEFLV